MRRVKFVGSHFSPSHLMIHPDQLQQVHGGNIPDLRMNYFPPNDTYPGREKYTLEMIAHDSQNIVPFFYSEHKYRNFIRLKGSVHPNVTSIRMVPQIPQFTDVTPLPPLIPEISLQSEPKKEEIAIPHQFHEQ